MHELPVPRLIEVYAGHADIELSPYRSWTLKSGRIAGGEPDECYIVAADQSKDRPDIVIEVIWTSGSIDTLAIYQRLGIDEVWFWIAGHSKSTRYAETPTNVWPAAAGCQGSIAPYCAASSIAARCTSPSAISVRHAQRQLHLAIDDN